MSMKKDLLNRALAYLSKAVGSSGKPGVLGSIGQRLGLSAPSVGSVLAAARNNKLATALAIYEIGGLVDPMLQELMAADAEVRSLVEALSFEEDDVSDTSGAGDVTQFADEFSLISDGIAFCGGMDRFMRLRNALALKDDTIKLYVNVKALSRSL